jgi:hypothetical protein
VVNYQGNFDVNAFQRFRFHLAEAPEWERIYATFGDAGGTYVLRAGRKELYYGGPYASGRELENSAQL